MDLAENIALMESKLREHEHTHPNLVSLWRTRLISQTNKIHSTTQDFERASKLFATNPDPPMPTLALLICLLRSKTI